MGSTLTLSMFIILLSKLKVVLFLLPFHLPRESQIPRTLSILQSIVKNMLGEDWGYIVQ
jgi:hypothetical protein